MNETIGDNFRKVLDQISDSCRIANRPIEDVTLVVVTKGQPAEKINEVIEVGATVLGENYPEETLVKAKEIEKHFHPTWHMIGHIQSRKIKLLHPTFTTLHSIDRIEIAKKVDRYFFEKDDYCDVLLEVNSAGEDSKYGFDISSQNQKDYFLKTVYEMLSLSHLRFRGLMTMPPFAHDENENNVYFDICRELLIKIQNETGLENFNQLSMGTSSDFPAAIKCGATLIRVGEAIMGKRIKPFLNKEDK